MESQSLAILVIDENRLRASIIETGLRESGHDNVTVVHDIAGVARTIAEINPDVIVIDLENPNRDVLENMFQLSRAVKRPVAMFVDRADRASIEAAVEAGVSAYVVDGLKRERVKPILDMAIVRFNAFSRLSRELEEAKSELEDRKVIERAKGVLMRRASLDEQAAFGRLQKLAGDKNLKLVEAARLLVTADEVFQEGDG
jgi:response regulator NasT